jgi:glycerol-3-phosphate dehydrogenase
LVTSPSFWTANRNDTGFDTEPGSLESSLVRRGHALLHSYALTAGIALEETGAVLVAWDAAQAARLDEVVAKARANGYERATRMDPDELSRREPHLAARGDGNRRHP